jgi:hypothetical protein
MTASTSLEVDLLGTVATELGTIELLHYRGKFRTRREYRRFDTGRSAESVIPIGRESAQEWWNLCQRRGATFGEFPAVAP